MLESNAPKRACVCALACARLSRSFFEGFVTLGTAGIEEKRRRMAGRVSMQIMFCAKTDAEVLRADTIDKIEEQLRFAFGFVKKESRWEVTGAFVRVIAHTMCDTIAKPRHAADETSALLGRLWAGFRGENDPGHVPGLNKFLTFGEPPPPRAKVRAKNTLADGRRFSLFNDVDPKSVLSSLVDGLPKESNMSIFFKDVTEVLHTGGPAYFTAKHKMSRQDVTSNPPKILPVNFYQLDDGSWVRAEPHQVVEELENGPQADITRSLFIRISQWTARALSEFTRSATPTDMESALQQWLEEGITMVKESAADVMTNAEEAMGALVADLKTQAIGKVKECGEYIVSDAVEETSVHAPDKLDTGAVQVKAIVERVKSGVALLTTVSADLGRVIHPVEQVSRFLNTMTKDGPADMIVTGIVERIKLAWTRQKPQLEGLVGSFDSKLLRKGLDNLEKHLVGKLSQSQNVFNESFEQSILGKFGEKTVHFRVHRDVLLTSAGIVKASCLDGKLELELGDSLDNILGGHPGEIITEAVLGSSSPLIEKKPKMVLARVNGCHIGNREDIVQAAGGSGTLEIDARVPSPLHLLSRFRDELRFLFSMTRGELKKISEFVTFIDDVDMVLNVLAELVHYRNEVEATLQKYVQKEHRNAEVAQSLRTELAKELAQLSEALVRQTQNKLSSLSRILNFDRLLGETEAYLRSVFAAASGPTRFEPPRQVIELNIRLEITVTIMKRAHKLMNDAAKTIMEVHDPLVKTASFFEETANTMRKIADKKSMVTGTRDRWNRLTGSKTSDDNKKAALATKVSEWPVLLNEVENGLARTTAILGSFGDSDTDSTSSNNISAVVLALRQDLASLVLPSWAHDSGDFDRLKRVFDRGSAVYNEVKSNLDSLSESAFAEANNFVSAGTNMVQEVVEFEDLVGDDVTNEVVSQMFKPLVDLFKDAVGNELARRDAWQVRCLAIVYAKVVQRVLQTTTDTAEEIVPMTADASGTGPSGEVANAPDDPKKLPNATRIELLHQIEASMMKRLVDEKHPQARNALMAIEVIDDLLTMFDRTEPTMSQGQQKLVGKLQELQTIILADGAGAPTAPEFSDGLEEHNVRKARNLQPAINEWEKRHHKAPYMFHHKHVHKAPNVYLHHQLKSLHESSYIDAKTHLWTRLNQNMQVSPFDPSLVYRMR